LTWIAVEIDIVNTKVALLLGALRKLELDLPGATALLVFHNTAILLALGGLLASCAVRHGVVHLDIRVTGDRELVLGG